MKNFKQLTIALFVVAGIFSADAQTKEVDVKASKITWLGKKVTGQHDGNVSLKEGSLTMKNDVLVGGEFVVDMNSITVADLKAGQGKEKLEGHLKADDFFGVEKYPTAKLDFVKVSQKSANAYTVTANLTVKGKTSPVTFDMNVTGNKATAKVLIDRTKYGIEYKSGSVFSGLGDATIYDDFELNATLVF